MEIEDFKEGVEYNFNGKTLTTKCERCYKNSDGLIFYDNEGEAQKLQKYQLSYIKTQEEYEQWYNEAMQKAEMRQENKIAQENEIARWTKKRDSLVFHKTGYKAFKVTRYNGDYISCIVIAKTAAQAEEGSLRYLEGEISKIECLGWDVAMPTIKTETYYENPYNKSGF